MSAVVSPTVSPGAAAGDALVIRIHPNDDVVIARRQLVGGTRIESEGVTVVGLIPPGHKVATRAIAAGAPVRRYDQIIGSAKQAIAPGQHVHTHNLEFSSFAREYAAASGAPAAIARVATLWPGGIRPTTVMPSLSMRVPPTSWRRAMTTSSLG